MPALAILGAHRRNTFPSFDGPIRVVVMTGTHGRDAAAQIPCAPRIVNVGLVLVRAAESTLGQIGARQA